MRFTSGGAAATDVHLSDSAQFPRAQRRGVDAELGVGLPALAQPEDEGLLRIERV